MRVSWIKDQNDNKSFKLFEKIGMNVISLENPEDIDIKMKNLINEKYNTIILTNEIASFSEDIIKKYKKNENINIIIAKRK